MAQKVSFAQIHETIARQPRVADRKILCLFPGDKKYSILPSKQAKQIHPDDIQRSWKVFLKAAKDVYGDRVDLACQSYGIDQRKPLRAMHVRMIEVRAMKLTMADLKKRFPGFISERSSPDRFTSAIEEMIPYPCYPLRRKGHEIHGAPTTMPSFFSYDPYLMDQELMTLFRDVGNLTRRAYIERLCKAIVPRELSEGMLIPAPCPGVRGKVDYYVVYKCISKGDGLVAYALKPASKDSKLRPVVVMRPSPYHPSGLDFLETWLNNMQRFLGWLGYQTARGDLSKLAYDPEFCPHDKKFDVYGYSVAGVHSQLFIADNFDRVGKVVLFNSPGADSETAEMFAVKVNAMPPSETPVKVRIYRTTGDIAQFAGGKLLFWGVDRPDIDVKLVEVTPTIKLTTKQCHGWRHFDSPEVNYTARAFTAPHELDKRLDNRKRGIDAIWYEDKRLFWGAYLVYPFLFIWSRLLQLCEKCFGVAILRRTPRIVNG